VAKPGNVPESRQSDPKRRPRWIYIGAGIAAVAAIGVALYAILGASLFPNYGPTNETNLEEKSGQAPGFSLPDQHRQTYTLTPGDGTKHLLIFYMGYF
jgi:cytochrome oxidase Cu insertion factor (SCO1/SenC/PrrC family)